VEGAVNPHEYYAFSNNTNFEGVMGGDGKWKLHLPHQYRTLDSAGSGGFPGRYAMMKIDTALFNMETDPYETTNVLKEHPRVAAELIRMAEAHSVRFYSVSQAP
jgi:arylsulfatase A